MIIQVELDGGEPRRYRVSREEDAFVVERLPEEEGVGTASAATGGEVGDGAAEEGASPSGDGPADEGASASGDGSGGESTPASDEEGDGEADEATHRVDLRRPETGVYSLLIDEQSFEVFVRDGDGDDGGTGDGGDLVVHLLNRTFSARAIDARRPRLEAMRAGAEGVGRVTAPIPGRVVEVLAPVGTEVAQGDGIVVLEAMKMENELKSPRDGVVASIDVEVGEGVQGGATVATVE